MMMQDIKKDLGILFSFSDADTPLTHENLRVIVGSKSEKFKNMETALKFKSSICTTGKELLLCYL